MQTRRCMIWGLAHSAAIEIGSKDWEHTTGASSTLTLGERFEDRAPPSAEGRACSLRCGCDIDGGNGFQPAKKFSNACRCCGLASLHVLGMRSPVSTTARNLS